MNKKHYILQAQNKYGKSVYIDDVPNGKKCECFCTECGGNLIAKNNGRIKIHHFAHENGNDSIKCCQTALHLLAKEIIAEERRIPIPRSGHIEFYDCNQIELEKRLDDIIPDIYALCENRPFIIEIFVSHKIDDQKAKKIEKKHISTVEINLSEGTYSSKDEIRNAIYNSKNTRIIYDDDIRIISERREIILNHGIKKQIQDNGCIKCTYANTFVTTDYCKQCVYNEEDETKLIHCGCFLPSLPKQALKNIDNIVSKDKKVMFTGESIDYNKFHFGWKLRETIQHIFMSQLLHQRKW